MFLRRTKSTSPFEHRALPPFSCSSFKDVHSLFEEAQEAHEASSKRLNLNVLHRVRSAKLLLRALSNELNVQQTQHNAKQHPIKRGLSEGHRAALLQNGAAEVVPGVLIFFTSLRVVRSTFEDCKYVRSILHSFPVAIDERDLFMDGSFIKDLHRIMGKDQEASLRLPRVFIGGRYFGGAEEIRRLHEAGQLNSCLQGLAPKLAGTCEACLGHGFVLCVQCNGSHKCYVEEAGFRACTGCNENGLVRCSSCSSAPL